ncbi:Secondary metabolism regulator LAE1 [Golovinomyces cichoracearum]|uniref:Secondary metabolism regulator LAE1 n=1 Tax=Golovinomyces cichoracearum TaxID=62708 RepID=A0A420IGA2_9PEZI|nr:Secondary metabolism regulator LAE1 [Golovinomyces cichoracearum]
MDHFAGPQRSAEALATRNADLNAATEQAEDEIEIDSENDDSSSDAGYETDSAGSISTSLSSSVRDYAFENGRRYHRFREGAYNFPNDDLEQEREDMKHAMMVNLCGSRLHFAPIGKNPQNVLDIGTGTGIWAVEMGDLYPGANILGVDLSPIQPEWVPPNVTFMVDDVESPWLKPRDYYDYIHARHTVMAIRDWPQLLQRAYDHLKPGGWIELQEIHHYPQSNDESMPANYLVTQYWELINEALTVLGIDFNATQLLEHRMREAGFINVSCKILHVPIGVWPKNGILKLVGLYWRTILIDGLQPIALGPLTRGLKWTKEQVDVWLVDVRKAYMDSRVHSHMPLYLIWGQKPKRDGVH